MTNISAISTDSTKNIAFTPPRLRARAEAALAFALFLLAGLWVAATLIAIANFGFRYPAFDQFRLYHAYLNIPFPANLLLLENGHRPIVPGLLRLAEIRWFSANQLLQLSVGVAAAVGTWLLVVITLVRERGISRASRAAACVLAALAVFWLGNARMLMHGNELAHVYFVMFGLVAALLAVNRVAADEYPQRWMAVAALCCVLATFSFGAGVVTFAAILLTAAVLRVAWKTLLVPAGVLLAAVGFYLFSLPDGERVAGALRVEPMTDIVRTLRWLAAPWMRAGLGYADPPIEASLLPTPAFQRNVGAGIVVVARWLADLFGGDWIMREGAAVGMIGVVAYAAMCVHICRRGRTARGTAALAFGLSSFALMTGVLVCINRGPQFAAYPIQIYADRYLPWSCLFWCGLALYAIAVAPRQRRACMWVHAAVALVVGVLLVPSQLAIEAWSSAVHRDVAQSAIAGQLGIWDPARLPDNADARRSDVLQTFAALRRERLSMFAEPAYALWSGGWRATGESPPAIGAARVVRSFDDDGRKIAAFEGWLPKTFAVPRDAVLVVTDAGGALRGLAKLGFFTAQQTLTKWTMPVMRGFDGYVIAPLPGERLRVRVLDAASRTTLGDVDLVIPSDT